MDVETFLQQLRTQEPFAMEAAARDLGRDLAATDGGDLRAVRKKLAALARAPSPSFAGGFLSALMMVTRGFESEREDAAEDGALIAAVRSRKHWGAALDGIASDCVRPSDLADVLGIDAPHMTRVLDELGEVGLVARRAPVPGEDGRIRPCRLTTRGRLVHSKLHPHPTVGPIKDIVEAVVWSITRLLASGHTNKRDVTADIEARLAPSVVAPVLAALMDSLEWTALAVVDGESLMAPDVEVNSELDQLLEDAMDNDAAPLVLSLRSLSEARPLVIRTRRFRWDVVVTRRDLTAIRVVRDDDLAAPSADLLSLAGDAFTVLYESPMLVRSDQTRPASGPFTAIMEQAAQRFVLGGAMTPPPPGFGVIDVHSQDWQPYARAA